MCASVYVQIFETQSLDASCPMAAATAGRTPGGVHCEVFVSLSDCPSVILFVDLICLSITCIRTRVCVYLSEYIHAYVGAFVSCFVHNNMSTVTRIDDGGQGIIT